VVAVDPRDRFVLTGASRPPSVQIVPLDGSPIRDLAGFSDPVWAVAVSPDGRSGAAGGGQMILEEAVVRVWDLDTDSVRVLDPADGHMFEDLLFTPGGGLLSASAGGLRQWDLADGTSRLLWAGQVLRFACAESQHRVVMCYLDSDGSRRLLQYDLSNGQTKDLASHGAELLDVAVSPDGWLVATGDRNGLVRVGSIGGGEPHLLLGHDGAVRCVSFSPDGLWITSAGDDGAVRLWPLPTGEPFHTLGHSQFHDRLCELTNLRVVRDDSTTTSYRLEPGPFGGWESVPDW